MLDKPIADDITVSKLESTIAEAFDLKATHKYNKDLNAKVWCNYEEKCHEVGMMLEKLEMKKYISKVGTFTAKLEEGYILPKDDESKEEFFAYLKEKEMYTSMITVNAASLNSYVKSEVEIAEARNDFNFIPPGVLRKDPWTKYSLTKKK